MAGRPLKKPEERRNRAKPQRGEWRTIAGHNNPPPPMPDGTWSERTRSAWDAWWTDDASGEWSTADRSLVVAAAFAHEEWVREGGAAMLSQVRQLLDSLGLTPKGRQDRRWQLPTTEPAADITAERKAKEARDAIKEMNKRAAAAEGSA